MINGKQVATRNIKKRTHERDVTILPFDAIDSKYHQKIISKIEEYGRFVEKRLNVTF